MKHDKAFAVLGTSTRGDSETSYDRYRPRLDSESSVVLSATDGQAIPIRRFLELTHTVTTHEDEGDLTAAILAFGQPHLQSHQNGNLDAFLTDSRLIFANRTIGRGGRRQVGHIRYPWIDAVAWRPGSTSSRPVVRLFMHEDFPIKALGNWFHFVELRFEDGFHPGQLALELAQRICAHNVAHGAPESAHGALREMASAVVQPDPNDDDEPMFSIPASIPCPWGAAYIGDDPQQAEWIVRVDEVVDIPTVQPTEPEPEPAEIVESETVAPHDDIDPATVGGILVSAKMAADRLGTNRISTQHLLLAVLADQDGPVAQRLKDSNVTFDRVLAHLQTEMGNSG